MRWPKYLDQYPLSVIAEYLGVRPGTVQNWARLKQLPKKHVIAVRAIRDNVRMANANRRKKLLKATDVDTLSELLELAGTPATRRQIAGWKRRGDVPLKFRVFLANAHFEKEDKKTSKRKKKQEGIGERSIVRRQTKNFNFAVVSWNMGDGLLLTDESLVDILSLVGNQKPPAESRTQFKYVGHAEFTEDDKLLATYATGQLIFNPESENEIKAYSEQFKDFRLTVKSFKKKLAKLLKKSFTFTELSLLITWRK